MMYGNYNGYSGGSYNEGGYGAGNYNEGGYGNSYGRRGVPGTGRGRYRGGYSGSEESMREIQEHFGAYSESSQAARSGNYGAEQDSKKALEYMLQAVCKFMEMLEKEANSPEESQMIKKYAKKIGEM